MSRENPVQRRRPHAAKAPAFLPFREARAYVRKLGIPTRRAYLVWCRENPDAPVPTAPETTYKDLGWKGFGDWLGTGRVYLSGDEFLSFEESREYARGLGLKNEAEWLRYCKSGKKPYCIPATPWNVYKKFGWSGIADWLGTGKGRIKRNSALSFDEARQFARSLGLRSEQEWHDWTKTPNRPRNIPACPAVFYGAPDWKGYRDWLGTTFLPFEEARAKMRTFGLKSEAEWRRWKAEGKRPADIPGNPNTVYADSGWINLRDWLVGE